MKHTLAGRRTSPRSQRLLAFLLALTVALPLFVADVGFASESRHASMELRYDDQGRVASFTYPSLATATYSYNYRAGQETVIYDGVEVVSSTRFGPTGQVIQRFIEDGSGGPSAVEDRVYDGLGRFREQRLAIDGQPVYSATEMTYDARGYLASLWRSDPMISNAELAYGYSEQGQLETFGIGAAQAQYQYDSRGNLLSRSSLAAYGLQLPSYSSPGTFDSANQPDSSDFEFDAAGRLVRDRDFVYSYNDAGRLALVEDHEGRLIAHYLYDTNGHRVRKMTETSVTYYYRSGGALISEETYDLEGERQEQKDFIAHNGQHLLTATHGTSLHYENQLSDRLGNPVVRWSDGDVSLQEYSPFGLQLNPAPADERQGAYGFTGHEEDSETGDIYMRARYFDPEAARFSSPDAARDVDPYAPASFNLYQYTRNNPTNRVDPTGNTSEPGDDDEEKKRITNEDLVKAQRANRAAFGSPSFREGGAGEALGLFLLELIFGFDHTASTETALGAASSTASDRAGQQPEAATSSASPSPPAEKAPRFVYRNGSTTPRNLTPRPRDLEGDKEPKGLSFFDSLEGASSPGKKAQVFDTHKLRELEATRDKHPPGHVTIAPKGGTDLLEWAATRGTDLVHRYTRELLESWVRQEKRKKE